MAPLRKEVVLLLISVFIGISYSNNFCEEKYTISVSKTRKESYVGTCYYKTSCGFFGWKRCRRSRDCTKYRTQTYYEAEVMEIQVCCTGYSGANCDIPVCDNCKNNAVCTAPNECYCRPGTTGEDCGISECNAENDCYPGTCLPDDTNCVCSSGFEGTSCSQIIEGGDIQSCNLNLQLNTGGVDSTNCLPTRYGSGLTVYTGQILPTLEVSYEVIFPIPNDIPPIPSEYMVLARFGLIESYLELLLNDKENKTKMGPISIKCVINTDQDQPSPTNPHVSLNCDNVKYNWPASVSPAHGDMLQISIFATSGGIKKYIDGSNEVHDRQFSGSTSKTTFHVTFDLDPPTNCLSACRPENPYGCEFLPDVSKLAKTTLDFGGWADDMSGLKEYRYTVYYMNVDSSGLLTEENVYIAQTNIPLYTTAPIELEFKNTGMYSTIFEAVDNNGNVAKARTLLLYDNTSRITTDEDYPVTLTDTQKIGTVYWIISASTLITVSWKNRYSNQILRNNRLLAQVKSRPDIQYDDNHGLRTINNVDNLRGISSYGIVTSKLNNPPPLNEFTTLHPSQEEHSQTMNFGGSNVLYLHLVAHDILGNVQADSFTVRMDDSLPTFRDTITFQKDVDSPLQDKPFVSSLTIHVDDIQSGIARINYNVLDTTISGGGSVVFTDFQEGQLHSDHTTDEDCDRTGECYCITELGCYTYQQVVWIDNCQFRHLSGHSFRFDFNAVNGAGLSWSTYQTFLIGTIDTLQGLGIYPPPQNVRAIELPNNVYQMNITWRYLPSCYPKANIEIGYESGGNTRSHSVSPSLTFKLIDGLRPLTDYKVTITIVYEGGETASNKVEFSTRADGVDDTKEDQHDSGPTIDTTTWIGVGVGAACFLILVGAITCILVRWRRKQPIVSTAMRNSLNNVRQRISTVGRPSRGAEGAVSIETKNRAYVDNDYYSEVKSIKVAYTCKGEAGTYVYSTRNADDELYSYDGAGYCNWKLSKDTVDIGNKLEQGSFAVICVGTLCKSSKKIDVIVKMNKVGASDIDKTLMNEKMSFLSKVPHHDNILKFVAAVPEPEGPMLILEHCEMGTLLNCLKNMADTELDNVAEQVANGMRHLHQNGIIHRHLAAKNVLLTKDNKGRLVSKVAGFGPAKGDRIEWIDERKGDRVRTKWLAPEQFKRKQGKIRHYSKATDIWTYGILLHEVYSKGEPPYKSLTDSGVEEKVTAGYREPMHRNCHDAIYREVMLKCWDKDPSQRPQFDVIVRILPQSFNADQEEYAYKQADYPLPEEQYSNVD